MPAKVIQVPTKVIRVPTKVIRVPTEVSRVPTKVSGGPTLVRDMFRILPKTLTVERDFLRPPPPQSRSQKALERNNAYFLDVSLGQ